MSPINGDHPHHYGHDVHCPKPEEDPAWRLINQLEDALVRTIDQRDRAVRALAQLWAHEIPSPITDLLDEDWAKAVLDDG